MNKVDQASERLAIGITIAVGITLTCAVLAIFPDCPWWAPALGSWIGVLFHLGVLFYAVMREARQ